MRLFSHLSSPIKHVSSDGFSCSNDRFIVNSVTNSKCSNISDEYEFDLRSCQRMSGFDEFAASDLPPVGCPDRLRALDKLSTSPSPFS